MSKRRENGQSTTLRGEMSAKFAAVDGQFITLRGEMDRGLASLQHDIRQGDADTRSQLGALIKSLRDDIRMIAEGHVDFDRRVRRLEGRG